MGILEHLVSISEEFVWQARQRALEQRRVLELLELQGNTEAARRAEAVLATLERAYRVALYRLKADCVVRDDQTH